MKIWLMIGEKNKYFQYADEIRTFSKWNPAFLQGIARDAMVFLGKGKE
jgi:hypothetical protein